jgi:hypothetical protein
VSIYVIRPADVEEWALGGHIGRGLSVLAESDFFSPICEVSCSGSSERRSYRTRVVCSGQANYEEGGEQGSL